MTKCKQLGHEVGEGSREEQGDGGLQGSNKEEAHIIFPGNDWLSPVVYYFPDRTLPLTNTTKSEASDRVIWSKQMRNFQ